MLKILFLLMIILFSCSDYVDLFLYEKEDKFNAYISRLDQKKFTENIVKGSLPIAIKDNIDVKGFANTAGSLALKDNYPKNNAFLVQKLLDMIFLYLVKQTFLSGQTSDQPHQLVDGHLWVVKQLTLLAQIEILVVLALAPLLPLLQGWSKWL